MDHDSDRQKPASAATPSLEGTKIGRYQLLQELGEGGFGIVYLAQQCEPVKRRVALKVIKPGMDTKQVLARFEAERQALQNKQGGGAIKTQIYSPYRYMTKDDVRDGSCFNPEEYAKILR